MSLRIIFLLLLFLLGAGAASAQGSLGRPDHTDEEESMVNEMRARWEIKYAEKERLENLDRAREAAQLGSEMYHNYSSNQGYTALERKKLERLEKITRKIRNQAGGTDGDVTIENMPNQLEAAFKRLAELTADLKKAVEKTPRQVVSATVIERSNEVLEIIRFVRLNAR